MKLALITAAVLAIAMPAYADQTSQALREFGWVGKWSPDCAAREVVTTNDIPYLGAPTSTVVVSKYPAIITIWTVTSAKMVTDTKLMIDRVSITKDEHNDDSVRHVDVLMMVDHKIMLWSQHVYNNFSFNGVVTEKNDVVTVADGIGAPRFLEKCRD